MFKQTLKNLHDTLANELIAHTVSLPYEILHIKAVADPRGSVLHLIKKGQDPPLKQADRQDLDMRFRFLREP